MHNPGAKPLRGFFSFLTNRVRLDFVRFKGFLHFISRHIGADDLIPLKLI